MARAEQAQQLYLKFHDVPRVCRVGRWASDKSLNSDLQIQSALLVRNTYQQEPWYSCNGILIVSLQAFWTMSDDVLVLFQAARESYAVRVRVSLKR